jgi:hypothetical protein
MKKLTKKNVNKNQNILRVWNAFGLKWKLTYRL